MRNASTDNLWPCLTELQLIVQCIMVSLFFNFRMGI